MRASDSWYDDDHSGFGRPPRRTRPRTKDRPDYSELPLGRVVGIDRGRYRCHCNGVIVSAAKARNLGRKAVIVGDLVRLDADVSGDDGSLARIADVEPRTTVLRRTADDTDPFERPIVANADQLVIVAALADPAPRLGMIDRVLVAAFDAGLAPVLALTKADLDSPDEILRQYAPAGVASVVMSPGCDLAALIDIVTDHVSVFVGHSGVGKSTLVNALIPGAERSTGEVNDVTGKGRHTSTSAVALELPGGGWVIDTPGVRSFGLSHVSADHILRAFSDLEEITRACPRGCTHMADEGGCALDEAQRTGGVDEARLASFRRLNPAAFENRPL